MSLSQEYLEARAIAQRITAEVGEPVFYVLQREAVETSGRLFREQPLVARALAALGAEPDRIGHGLSHVTKVALDAGAIILIERGNGGRIEQVYRLVAMAHVAGVLHDIRREEKDHARKGAEEAERMLRDFDLDSGERLAIGGAIANHEAFRPSNPMGEPDWQLLSDALYDADKFRWGPDNFSEMLWDMVSRRNVPLSAVMGRFLKGLEGIDRIRETFRSDTGRKYGPDFIDRGMEIGRRLYAELTK
ncbi:MAG: hypothetical protein MUE57_08080 [Syntrophales bacterium]|nr:hypothetical protein [Syntrophales bacterium]MCU0583779.1 hypothetical protein [Syntrophales bacterium]